MLLRQLFAVHQEGEHHIVLHGALERNAVVVAIDAAEDHIARGLFIGAGIFEQLLERNAAPCRVAHAVPARQCVDAHECRDLIVGIAIQNIAPAERHRSVHGAFDMEFPLFDIEVSRHRDGASRRSSPHRTLNWV